MFVIVRHGNTFEASQPARRIGSRTDLPLTAQGIAQARALGHLFASRNWSFARALVSPLLRTQQTAKAILDQTEGPLPELETSEFLREIDHGPDENATEDQVLDRIGSKALAAWDKSAIAPPGWEVDADMRLEAWRHILMEEISPDPILFVTSNGAGRFALLANKTLQSAAENLPSMKLPTGGYGVIKRTSDGRLELAEWGRRP